MYLEPPVQTQVSVFLHGLGIRSHGLVKTSEKFMEVNKTLKYNALKQVRVE